MQTYDFSPFYRSTVGFDRVFNRLDALVGQEQKTYPPYNIEKTGACLLQGAPFEEAGHPHGSRRM